MIFPSNETCPHVLQVICKLLHWSDFCLKLHTDINDLEAFKKD